MIESDRDRHPAELALAIVILLASMPLWGWALSKLWLWFLVPLGVPRVGMWHASGVAIVIALMRANADKAFTLSQQDVPIWWRVGWEFVTPFCALGLGLLCRWGMSL